MGPQTNPFTPPSLPLPVCLRAVKVLCEAGCDVQTENSVSSLGLPLKISVTLGHHLTSVAGVGGMK